MKIFVTLDEAGGSDQPYDEPTACSRYIKGPCASATQFSLDLNYGPARKNVCL